MHVLNSTNFEEHAVKHINLILQLKFFYIGNYTILLLH